MSPQIVMPKQMPVSPGTSSLEIKKPLGVKVIIRRITVYTKYSTYFSRWSGYIRDIATPTHGICLLDKWLAGHAGFKLLFEGSVEWHEGWHMTLIGISQTASDVFTYIVSYDVGPPKKKGWGD